jgi:hypothetical protein
MDNEKNDATALVDDRSPEASSDYSVPERES